MAGMPAPDIAGTCLITGASAGIGKAFAHELAGRGYGVTLLARREERLCALAAELASRDGVRADVLSCDLADPETRRTLPGRIAALGLHVDVLVSNAGLGSHGRFVGLDPRGEVEQVRVMCEASVDLCGMFIPPMVKRGSGAVLIVSSLSAFQPMPNTATYGASKAFLLSLGESLHAELRGSGVAVSTLCPGPVRTEFFQEGDRHPSERMPGPAWKSPEEVARAGLDALDRNLRVVTPGAIARGLAFSGRFSPHALQLRVLERLYR